MFGGTRRTRRTVQRGSDLRYDLEITLEEAATGKEEKLRIPRLEKCDECEGKGAEKGNSRNLHHLRRQRPDALPAGIFQCDAHVRELQGKGQIIKTRARIATAPGRVEKEKTLEIKIPAGVETGSRLRVNGEGEAGVTAARRAIFSSSSTSPSTKFRTAGSESIFRRAGHFAQAALRPAEIKVKTLDGEEDLKIPAGTQTGTVFRLKSHGMPVLAVAATAIFSSPSP